MWGFLEDGHTMVIGLPDLAYKNLVFDPATLKWSLGDHASLQGTYNLVPMYSLRIFKSINTFAKTDLSFSLKVYNMREK